MSELELYKGMVKKMKDDKIKEKLKLIDGFFNKAWACDLDEVYRAVIDTVTNLQQKNEYLETWNNEIKLQLDNLQQENERLEEENESLKEDRKYLLQYYNEDYKSRCEEARNYINHLKKTFIETDEMWDLLNNAIDILNGKE